MVTALVGCAGNHASQAVPAINEGVSHTMTRQTQSSPIQHVIIVVQENRTVDNLFQGLAGANTQPYGLNSQNQEVPLTPEPLTAPYDLNHGHSGWVTDYNKEGMNGFDLNLETCEPNATCPQKNVAAYGYVPLTETQPLVDMAEQFAFGDEMFQTNQGPSYPAHQYLVSGSATVANGSPYSILANAKLNGNGEYNYGGCDSPQGTIVSTISMVTGKLGPNLFPCFFRKSLINLLISSKITWKYYQAASGAGLWNAVDDLHAIWNNKRLYNANVVSPPSQFLTDVQNGNLAQVTWVTPTALASDHASITDGSGPSWVASIVNTVAASPFWDSTAIIVTWDDWGGWYDHVAPTVRNPYELGFRVPLLVISPYVKSAGYVSHVGYEFREHLEVHGGAIRPSADWDDGYNR